MSATDMRRSELRWVTVIQDVGCQFSKRKTIRCKFFSSGDLPVYIEPYIFDASAAHNKENIAIVWLISVHITPKFYMVFISATVEESAGESQV